MTCYAMITLAIKDPEKLKAYQAAAGSAVAKHGGKPIAGGGASTVLQAQTSPMLGVILEFSAQENIQAWLDDPELADLHAMRNEAADVTILAAPPIG